MNKKQKNRKKIGCSCCGKIGNPEDMFLHSKCCGVHFEGRISKEGLVYITCEKCGKFIGWVSNKKRA